MTAYYNENDPYAAEWLRNLITAGLIAPGDVDERSIVDVQANDVRGYSQCHFFAGLGGWSLALRVAGWPDHRPVWTGSCPCQPFSAAGNQEGFNDPRHLWPEFKRLIAQRLPSVVFGEQVAAATAWLNLVRGDLEKMGYALGAMPVEAASAGADHFRDRLWFVADHDIQCPGEEWVQRGGEFGGPSGDPQDSLGSVSLGDDSKWWPDCASRNVDDRETSEWKEGAGNASERPFGNVEHDPSLGWGEGWTEHEFRRRGFTAAVADLGGSQYVECPDGKWRRLPPPGVRWLGNGIPARVDKLRAIGNAIDHRPAAEVIRAYMAIVDDVAASLNG